MVVHQCVRFCNNLRLVHKLTIIHIAKYLASPSTYVDLPDGYQRFSTRNVVYKPDKEKYIRCYVYADFSDGWDQVDADNVEMLCRV